MAFVDAGVRPGVDGGLSAFGATVRADGPRLLESERSAVGASGVVPRLGQLRLERAALRRERSTASAVEWRLYRGGPGAELQLHRARAAVDGVHRRYPARESQ